MKKKLNNTLKIMKKGSKYDLILILLLCTKYSNKWRPSSLNELTPMICNKGLTHLGSEASKYYDIISVFTSYILIFY